MRCAHGRCVNRSEIVVLESAAAVAQAAAARYASAAAAAVAARGCFVVALSGGSTPRTLYRLLASADVGLPWNKTRVLFADERCLSPEHELSNYRMAQENLLGSVAIPAQQVHRMRGELEAEAAALCYERELQSLFPGCDWPAIDLALLGMGRDGHTASLFPGTQALEERRRWAAANYVPQQASWRITLTLPVLCAARRILFLITGADKSQVLAEAFGGLPHDAPYPAEAVVPTQGVREILVDRQAASMLP